MPQSIINKSLTQEKTHKYLYTSMVSHRGTPISFAMRDDGHIFYSVLDMSNTEQNANIKSKDGDNDKNYWSKVTFEKGSVSRLQFPEEIMQVSYGVVPNFKIEKHDKDNKKIIHSYDNEDNPLDEKENKLSDQAIKDKTDPFYSSTARLGAEAPFQVLSDGKYIYLFRQSIAAGHTNQQYTEVKGTTDKPEPIVNNTLLVDRFILSGSALKLSREIRYQRSRHKTEPESRKDTLAAVDVEGNPFYEPTRELVFAKNLSKGGFSVLLIPGADSEEQRWQIFTTDSETGKVNSFNIRFDYSIVFDTSDSQIVVDEFIQKYELNDEFISEVQEKIDSNRKDSLIVDDFLPSEHFKNFDDEAKLVAKDALGEVVYTVRTGVSKDDFLLESASEWPLIEYDGKGNVKKTNENGDPYVDKGGVLLDKFAFLHGPSNHSLKPESSRFLPKNGLSSCYYYQQEMGPDGKPMKNKACAMLALGLEDKQKNKYIGILNFATAASGRLSRPTIDGINLPDINVQALDENPYRDLADLNKVAWQEPQKMGLLDIDPNGLSTSGGVLKFAYTSANVGTSQGYSDAVEATAPYIFDDSLGRVNLYFMGRNKNFFVLYFNPTGSKSVEVTHLDSQSGGGPFPLSLKPRLDRDMNIDVTAQVPVPDDSITCTLLMKTPTGVVETWNYLPRRFSQISGILNGNGELSLGTLEPLGNASDPMAAYLRHGTGNGPLKLRTTVENNLIFKTQHAYAAEVAGGKKHSLSLNDLSTFLVNHNSIKIAKKAFSLVGDVELQADVFYRSYLSGMVNDPEDINKLWDYLKTQVIVRELVGKPDQANLQKDSFEIDTKRPLSEVLADQGIKDLFLKLLKEGNAADKQARLARLKQSLIALIRDVANVRIITFKVQDENSQSVDRLGAGLAVSVVYDYTHFNCSPDKLGGESSASKWEHARSYLFNAELEYDENTDATTEISPDFKYQYDINNTIGQWEDWEASLAFEMEGASLSSIDSSKLEVSKPSEKGLSVEAWIKPAKDLTQSGSILSYKNGEYHYSLGIEKHDSNRYTCVATLGNKKYTSKNSFALQENGKRKWRHLAFTHKKYWGFELQNGNTINCGNDSSLQLADEFSLEVLVKVNSAGTILEKKDEYSLSVNSNKEVVFNWGAKNYLAELVKMKKAPTNAQKSDSENYQEREEEWYQKSKPNKLDSLGEFYKITLIRSRNKPQTESSKLVYPNTGDYDTENAGGTKSSDSKWYEDIDSDEIMEGMAEKQDQMEKSMKFYQTNMLGNAFGSSADSSSEYNPTYYHSLVVTKGDNSAEWTSPSAEEIESVEAFKDCVMGGGNFKGSFSSVRIWNRALSISEAKELSVSENKAGLLSHWRMAEGKGKYLYDEVSENHGVAEGGKWVNSPQSNQAGQFQFHVDGSPEDNATPVNISPEGVDQLSISATKNTAVLRNNLRVLWKKSGSECSPHKRADYR